MILLVSACLFILLLAACKGNGEIFDPKVEQEKATTVMNGVLTSFEDQEKLAEAKTRDEANPIAWKKIKEKNSKSISIDLTESDQRRLLYLLTTNKAEDLPNGETKANLLFSADTENKNVDFNENDKTFTFDIERSGFDHKLITLEKQEGVWKLINVQDPE